MKKTDVWSETGNTSMRNTEKMHAHTHTHTLPSLSTDLARQALMRGTTLLYVQKICTSVDANSAWWSLHTLASASITFKSSLKISYITQTFNHTV